MITLPAAIAAFLLARQAEGLSKRTITWYAGKLAQFALHVGDQTLAAIDADIVRRYLVELRSRTVLYPGQRRECTGTLSPHTLRGHDRLLRCFFSWCSAEYRLDPQSNPMSRIKKPVAGNATPTAHFM